MCRSQLQFNAEHEAWLEAQFEFDCARREVWGKWLLENERLHDAWDALDWACYQPDGRDWMGEQHLDRLRRLLGREAYEAGRMPPAVPVWRFRKIR